MIRLGKNNDGGYLINSKDIERTEVLLSFGIGEDCTFEKHFTRPCIAYDKSVTKADLFFSGRNILKRMNVGEDISLSNVLSQCGFNIFLKCDIEGNEYVLLDELIRNSHRFSGMVFEFHGLENPKNFDAVTNFISKIHLNLIHVHGNNYFYYKTENGAVLSVVELSFSSSQNILYNENLELPHVLDMPNNPNDNEFKIKFGYK